MRPTEITLWVMVFIGCAVILAAIAGCNLPPPKYQPGDVCRLKTGEVEIRYLFDPHQHSEFEGEIKNGYGYSVGVMAKVSGSHGGVTAERGYYFVMVHPQDTVPIRIFGHQTVFYLYDDKGVQIGFLKE